MVRTKVKPHGILVVSNLVVSARTRCVDVGNVLIAYLLLYMALQSRGRSCRR